MTLVAIQNKLIPGYSFLNTQQRAFFEDSQAGKKFLQTCQLLNQETGVTQGLAGMLEKIFLGFNLSKEQFTDNLNQNKNDLLVQIENTQEYKLIQKQISVNILTQKFCPEFKFLNPKLKNQVSEIPYTKALIQAYLENNYSQKHAELKEIKKEILFQLILPYLNSATGTNLRFLHLNADNLKLFNEEQGRIIAEHMLADLKLKNELNFQKYIDVYKTNMTVFIKKQMLLINGEPKINYQYPLNFKESLSKLWADKNIAEADTFVKRLAAAHAFLTTTGFSSQNDNIVNTILELYNTNEIKDTVLEAKNILSSLAQPFIPLYNEYNDIALYEQNTFAKIIRSLMPIIILTGFVILVSVLLGPLAIPEVALAFILIPVIVVGIGLASAYAAFKNVLYHSTRQLIYGGAYEIPEYQVNQRMIKAFGKDEASEIRNFYIKEIQQCEAIEHIFQDPKNIGQFSEDELVFKKQKIERKYSLFLEWYDIHDNNDLGTDKAREIVKKRWGLDINDESWYMDYFYKKEELDKTQTLINSVGEDIDSNIQKDSLESVETRPSLTMSNANRHAFFQPGKNYQQHKEMASELQTRLDKGFKAA